MATMEEIRAMADARGVTIAHVKRYLKKYTLEQIRARWWLDPLPALKLEDLEPQTCQAIWRAVLWRAWLDLGRKPQELSAWIMSQDFTDVCEMADVDAIYATRTLLRSKFKGSNHYHCKYLGRYKSWKKTGATNGHKKT